MFLCPEDPFQDLNIFPKPCLKQSVLIFLYFLLLTSMTVLICLSFKCTCAHLANHKQDELFWMAGQPAVMVIMRRLKTPQTKRRNADALLIITTTTKRSITIHCKKREGATTDQRQRRYGRTAEDEWVFAHCRRHQKCWLHFNGHNGGHDLCFNFVQLQNPKNKPIQFDYSQQRCGVHNIISKPCWVGLKVQATPSRGNGRQQQEQKGLLRMRFL